MMGVTVSADFSTVIKDQEDHAKALRVEASRLAALANKRLKRLENGGLMDTPAYQKWIREGGEYFGVRGKDYNEVQKEMGRLRRFINSETSTIRGINGVLKDMAQNTGIKYKNYEELRSKASSFFTLSSKVEQYLRTVDDMGSAIGYQKIWEAINEYVEDEEINLDTSDDDIEDLTVKVAEAIQREFIAETFQEIEDNWFNLPNAKK